MDIPQPSYILIDPDNYNVPYYPPNDNTSGVDLRTLQMENIPLRTGPSFWTSQAYFDSMIGNVRQEQGINPLLMLGLVGLGIFAVTKA